MSPIKNVTMTQLRNISVLLLMMSLYCCAYQQQQQHDQVMAEVMRYNEAHINELHASAVQTHRESFAAFRNQLAKAEKAAWVRERGDCCCTGAELDPVSPSPLSKKEFREVVELLSQAQAEPAPRREDMKPEKLASAMWHEETGWQMNLEPAPMIIMPPWADLQIDKLSLQNAKGEELLSISYDFNRKEKSKELNFVKAGWGGVETSYQGCWIELPGDAYSRFQNHPARLRFKKKVDAADKD